MQWIWVHRKNRSHLIFSFYIRGNPGPKKVMHAESTAWSWHNPEMIPFFALSLRGVTEGMSVERTDTHPFDLMWISWNLLFCMGWALFGETELLITRESQAETDWNITVKIQASVEDWSRRSLRLINPDLLFKIVLNSLWKYIYSSLIWGHLFIWPCQGSLSQIGLKAKWMIGLWE